MGGYAAGSNPNVTIHDATTGDNLHINPDGSADVRVVNTLVPDKFDFIGASYPSSTVEVYTYKTGGASGTIVAVVTVTYSDPTKNAIISAARI